MSGNSTAAMPSAPSVEHVEASHPPHLAEPFGHRLDLGREREGLRLAGLRLWSQTATSTARKSRKSMRPASARKLKRTTCFGDSDADAGHERDRERHHAADHGGGECPDEGAGAEGRQRAGRAGLSGDQDHRERGQEPADGPHQQSRRAWD